MGDRGGDEAAPWAIAQQPDSESLDSPPASPTPWRGDSDVHQSPSDIRAAAASRRQSLTRRPPVPTAARGSSTSINTPSGRPAVSRNGSFVGSPHSSLAGSVSSHHDHDHSFASPPSGHSNIQTATDRTPLISPRWHPQVHETCPTCKGKGKIAKDALRHDELIALIPVKDQRLKPKRTKLIIGLTVLVTAASLGLIIFFLFPRGMDASISEGQVVALEYACCVSDSAMQIKQTNMTFQFPMHFFNPNYLSATIHSANVSVISQRARDVGFGTLDKLHIKGRKHRDGFVNVKGIYNADAHAAIMNCMNSYVVAEILLNSTVNVLAFHDGLQFDQILRMYCAFDIFSSYQNCTLSCSGYDPENQGPYIIRPEPLPPSPVPTQSPTQHTLRPTPWPTPPPTPAPTPNATLPTPQPTPGPTPAPTNASVPV